MLGVCVCCVLMCCPLLNAILISHRVKDGPSTVIHQQVTEGGMQGWMGTREEKRMIKNVGGNGWRSGEKGHREK